MTKEHDPAFEPPDTCLHNQEWCETCAFVFGSRWLHPDDERHALTRYNPYDPRGDHERPLARKWPEPKL